MRRIGYVTIGSSSDVRVWSGLNAHILMALRQAGLEVTVVDELLTKAAWPRLKGRFSAKFLGRSCPLDRNLSVARGWAQQVSRKLSLDPGIHVVVSPSTLPIAFLPDRYRTVVWSDATFHSLRTTYPNFETLSRKSGIKARSREHCRLVFVGVDWVRKGGPLVLEIAKRLNALGIPVRLSLVGCHRPESVLPPYVEYVGFLDKQRPAERAQLERLMQSAHLLVVPSRAECYGLVYAEASAYGVPCIGNDVGGVSTAISDGVNGILFRLDAPVSEYVDVIARLWNSVTDYERLAIASYGEWNRRLNWSVAAGALRQLVEAVDPAGVG